MAYFNHYDPDGGDIAWQQEGALSNAIEHISDVKARCICPVHKRKRISITYDYDLEATHAYVSKGCCPEFRKLVAEELRREDVFDEVHIID